MVAIIIELQKSWWRPGSRRTEVVVGQNFQEALVNAKKLQGELPDYQFINHMKIYSA